MAKKGKELKQKLKEVGAVFIRRNKHEIWRLPNGKTLTISASASDCNWERENIRLINKLCG